MFRKEKPSLFRLFAYWKAHFVGAKEAKETVFTAISSLVTLGGIVAMALHFFGVLPDRIAESNWTPFVEIVAVLCGGFYLFIWRPYVQHEGQERQIGTLKDEIARLTTPVFQIECGESVSAVARNRPIVLSELKDLLMGGQILDERKLTADFLGFIIRNTSAATISDCRCEFVGLESGGRMLWTEKAALPFAPREAGRDGITQMDIRSQVEQAVAVCTITEEQKVMFGSLSQTWRFPEPFHTFFHQAGEYIFHVCISGEGTPTARVRFLLNWTGNKSTTMLTLANG